MIQRVQTIFLSLIVLLMIATLFTRGWHKTAEDSDARAELTAFQLTYQPGDQAPPRQETTIYIALLALAAAALATYEIFSYRNRMRQMKLGALNSLLMAGVVASILLLARRGENFLEPEQMGSYGPALYLTMVALGCNVLANRFIRRDEQLVRSADRFR